jgi:hypothetical protein
MLCSYGAENLPPARHWNKDNCRHVFLVPFLGNGRKLFSGGWKRHGDDLWKVKNACEKSYVSFWIFRWHKERSLFSSLSMQSFLFHVFPEKKECGF